MYRTQVERAETILKGDPLLLRATAPPHGSDEDGRSRDGAVLGRLLKLHRKRHWLVNTHSYAVTFPATGGGVWVAVVVAGVCRRVSRVRTRRELEAAFEPDARVCGPVRMGHFEADASTVLAHWIRRPPEEHSVKVLELDENDLEASLQAAAQRLASDLPW